jgi:nucleotide-binding universal stress UspA family protein
VQFHTIQGDSIWKSLHEYAEDNAIDLIVTISQRRSFWSQLFHKSTTKALVLHANKPLLVLHLDDK